MSTVASWPTTRKIAWVPVITPAQSPARGDWSREPSHPVKTTVPMASNPLGRRSAQGWKPPASRQDSTPRR